MSNSKLPRIVLADTVSIKADADPAAAKAVAGCVKASRIHANTCKYVTYARLTGDQNLYMDRMLAVLPGEKVEDLLSALESTLEANETMQAFYEGHKAKFVE